MSDATLKQTLYEVKQLMPLVLEIIPGHAAEGLIDIYEPGSYEGESLRGLCDRTLSRKNLSIEEQLILEDVSRQLQGGKLLCRGEEIDGRLLEFAISEQTKAGEKYFYVPVRAIRPQEGGWFTPVLGK
jgi:hypothetical protein